MAPPPVDVVLTRRTALATRRRWTGWSASLVLHGGAAAGILLAPGLAAPPRETPRYVAVQLVPLAALGVERPAPAPTQPAVPPAAAEPPAPSPSRPERTPPVEPERSPPARPAERPREEPLLPFGADPPAGPLGRDPGLRQGSPTGRAAGSSPFGAAVAGLDNPDFVYGYYIDQMLALIRARWVRPALGGGAEAMVHFRIAGDGAVTEIRIVRSSGYDSFDLAGLRAVAAAAPLPPLPRSFRGDSLGVNLILR